MIAESPVHLSSVIPRSIEIEDLELRIHFADSETICLDFSSVFDKSPDEHYLGPLWDFKTHTLSLSYREAERLGCVLRKFAAALKATSADEEE